MMNEIFASGPKPGMLALDALISYKTLGMLDPTVSQLGNNIHPTDSQNPRQ